MIISRYNSTLLLMPLFFMAVGGHAQEDDSFRMPHTGIEGIGLPSVEAAALCRHVGHNMNYATGQASISVPLYTLQCGDMSLPLSAGYITRAVKVDDENGPIGISWDLRYGGIISRQVVGMPDEMYGTTIPSNEPTLDYLKSLDLYTADSDYDRYNYQAGEASGSFIIDNGSVVKLSPDDTKITRSADGSFHIVTVDGTEYVFDVAETVSYRFSTLAVDIRTQRPDYDNVVCAWRPGRIVNPARTDSIMFEYVGLPSRIRSVSAKVSYLSADNRSTEFINISYGNGIGNKNEHMFTYDNRHGLKRISCRAGSINFTDPATEPVKGFTVNTPDGNEVRRITFNYSYINNSKKEKALLKGISISSEGVQIDGASFEYFNESYPMQRRDIFGYNNTGTGMVDNCASVLTVSVPDNSSQFSKIVISDQRLPDSDAILTGTLRSVTSFAGAKTEFEYEPNEAEQKFVFDGVEYAISPGIRLKKETITDSNTGNIRVKEFSYTGGKSTIDFSKLGLSDYVSLSGSRGVYYTSSTAGPLSYLSSGAILLSSSRKPGASVEDAEVYYANVRERITGTGLETPVITDYQYDLADVECPLSITYPANIYIASENDERFCGTKITPNFNSIYSGVFPRLLAPQIITNYFRESFVERAPLVSKTEWITNSAGNTVRKYRVTRYSYSKDDETIRKTGFFSNPLVRSVSGLLSPTTDDYTAITDFNYFPVEVYSARLFCDSIKTTEYDASGLSRTVTKVFGYHDRFKIVKRSLDLIDIPIKATAGCCLPQKVEISCEGDTYSTEYLYIANSAASILTKEIRRGRKSAPLQQTFRHGGFMMQKNYNYSDYGMGKGNVQLSSVACRTNGNVLCDTLAFSGYDTYGNPLGAKDMSNKEDRYFWAGNGTYLSRYDKASYLSTKYQYSPLTGYSQITSPSGTVTDYTYTAGRLASHSVAGDRITSYYYYQYGSDRVNKIVSSMQGVNGGKVLSTVRYDAFGNKLLTATGGGNDMNSIATIEEYDALGRSLRRFMPASFSNIDGELTSLEQSVSTGYNGDSRPFAESMYDYGADERVHTITIGGDMFADHPLQMDYRFNCSADKGESRYSCRRYRVRDNSLVFDGYYPEGSLAITETTDGDGRKSLSFVDFSGKCVLVRSISDGGNADTYTVYDDAGNIVMVLPPLVSKALCANGSHYSIDNNDAIRDYADCYFYNERLLLSEKRCGGSEPVKYFYDASGNLVFSQDGEQRVRGVMRFCINDFYGRPAIEGEALASSQLQRNVASMRPYALRNQTLSGRIAGYGVSISLQNVVVDKAYYYDDYSFLSEDIFSALNDRLSSEPLTVKRSNNRGLLTGTITRLTTAADFDGSKTPTTANSEYMATAYGYDSRERVSQSVTATHKGIMLAVTTEYSGSDLPVTVITKHVNTDGTNSTVTQQYLYDDLDRQTAVTTSVDGVCMARIGTKYDDKGRIASIEMSDVRSAYRNTLSYGYLTNGRAKSIKSSTGKFEMTLGYNTGAYPSYSGNVSMMTWQGSDGTERIYNYRYDKHNRLIFADYGEIIRHLRSGMEIMGTPDYSVNYSYDLQGNAQTIQRKGMSGVTTDINKMYITFDNVDELTLNYNGNLLKNVTDTAPNVYYTGATDFDDGADEDIEYAYDGNGNMTVDLNRGIVNIVYNRLNLPTEIEFSNGQKLGNDYDADGNLYRRVMHNQLVSEQIKPGRKDKSNAIDTVIYCGPWQYVNGTLDRIHIPGGYIKDNKVYFYITILRLFFE